MLILSINFSFLYSFFIICNSILLLFVVFDEYKRISQKDIEQSIKSETSGSFEDALLAIGKLLEGGEWRKLFIDFPLCYQFVVIECRIFFFQE